MCEEAPHSFQDIYEATDPANHALLLQDLHGAQDLLGDYPMDEAGEAVVVYRLCRGKYQTPEEEEALNLMVIHYWKSICHAVARYAAAHYDETETVNDMMGMLTRVDQKVLEIARERSFGLSDAEMVRAYEIGKSVGRDAHARAFRDAAEYDGIN